MQHTANLQYQASLRDLPQAAVSLLRVNVGLGRDDVPCNNTNDLLQEIKLAAIIHKAASHDLTIISAEQVLGRATIMVPRHLDCKISLGAPRWARRPISWLSI